MSIDPKKLIAAINPGLYCDKSVKDEVSKLSKAGKYTEAAEKAKLVESDYLDVMDLAFTKGAFKSSGLKAPVESHKLIYDAFSQSLEPIYFWILDYINDNYKSSEKLIDNFTSSASSGHFAEMQGRATRMQEEAMKIFGTINTVVRSVLNIIYDLKEFKIRLSSYEDLHSENTGVRNAAILSLKQIWMDSVDIKRGNSSIKAMAQQFDYVTLIDAFMASKSLDSITKPVSEGGLDLNDRVKRILQQRYSDYTKWVKESEQELKKRYEIERTYLKAQVSSLKLYSRWLKPYLMAAKTLEQRASPDAALVQAFNTSLFELVLLGIDNYNPEAEIKSGDLPKGFDKKLKKKFNPIVLVEFKFRSAPDRADSRGGYSFRGRAEVSFTSFALDSEELKILKTEIEKDDIGDLLSIILGATDESLAQIKVDLDELLDEKKPKQEEKEEESEDTNPFTSLFSFLKSSDKKVESGLKKDNDFEKIARSQAILSARWKCRKLYGEYKKAHEMPTLPPVFR